MITPSLSGAQLDTIDPAELVEVCAWASALDRLEEGAEIMRVSICGRAAFTRILFASTSTQKTMQTLEAMPAPTFLEPSWPKSDRPLSNPSAPIPDRVRRQMARDPGKKPWHRR